jgi:hypothetical protein
MMNGSQIHLSMFQRIHEVREVKQLCRRRHLIRWNISVAWHVLFLSALKPGRPPSRA